MSTIGKSVTRLGLKDRVTGKAKFTADIKLPHMLHAKILRSPHPHANILSINTTAANMLQGVHAILTPNDVETLNPIGPDILTMDNKVRFVGDEVAAVAAEDNYTAQQALNLINVEYNLLPFFTDALEALKEGAESIHASGNLWQGEPLILTRGDVEQGFKESDIILEESYKVASHSPASLEPRVALAHWRNEHLTIWKTSRGIHQDRDTIAEALHMPSQQVQVIGPPIGAGYGSKDESRASIIAALLSKKAGRPVRLEYSRYEEFVAGRVRHGSNITLKIGVKKDGSIKAISNRTILDTGAYLASGAGVLRRAAQGSLYLYKCPNVRYEGYLVYTNNPVAGSYRGLGAPQGHFALETHIDRIAEALEMDPLTFRLKNHVPIEGQPGQRFTPGTQIVDTQPVEGGIPFSSNGLRECLTQGAKAIQWDTRSYPKMSNGSHLVEGTGVAMCIYRGGPGRDSTATVTLHWDGSIEISTGIIDVGQGSHTVLAQIVADSVGCLYEQVSVTASDTTMTPYASITAGSSSTFSCGIAARRAALKVRNHLLCLASKILEIPISQIDIQNGMVFDSTNTNIFIPLSQVATQISGSYFTATATVTPGSRRSIINSFAAHFARVQVNTDTGKITVLRYIAAHDSGKIINPQMALNQVEGGVSQMLGLTLTEELVVDQQSGVTINGSFLEHKSTTIADYPKLEVIFVETQDPEGPYGAKALGEPPSVPVAAAIVNAVYDAVGIRVSELPATPDKILLLLEEKAAGL